MSEADFARARVAGLRGRLLGADEIARLAEAPGAPAFIAALERHSDWTDVVGIVTALGASPTVTAEAAIERHRSARLARLPGLVGDHDRPLVEALVLPLDLERVLAVLRRRRAGEAPEAIAATLVRGALLDAWTLGRVAHASDAEGCFRPLAAAGVVAAADVPGLVLVASDAGPDGTRLLEVALATAVDRARRERVAGRGRSAAAIRQLLDRERDDRRQVQAELRDHGPLAASLVERTLTLERLDAQVRVARRDPLGITPLVAYVCGVEAQAVRLRGALARARGAWGQDLFASWLRVEVSVRWPGWWS